MQYLTKLSNRRRANPNYKIIIPAVLVGGYLLLRGRKAKAATTTMPTTTQPGVSLPPLPPPPTKPKPKYIGSGWTAWPHKDAYPTIDAIGETIARIGYPTWFVTDPLGDASKATVKQFQRDSNKVREWIKEFGTAEAEAPPSLKVDGLLGPKTINALYFADVQNDLIDGGWITIVGTAKTELADA